MNGPANVEGVGVVTSDATRRSVAWLAGFALGWELATATARRPPACPTSTNPPASADQPAGADQPASADQPAGAHRAGAV